MKLSVALTNVNLLCLVVEIFYKPSHEQLRIVGAPCPAVLKSEEEQMVDKITVYYNSSGATG